MHYILGLCTSIGIALLGLGSIIVLFFHAEGRIKFDNFILHTVYFSLSQALHSAILATFFGLLLALSLYRLKHYRFVAQYIQPVMIHFSSMMFVIPTTIAAHGILAIWGRGGLYMPIREAFDIPLFGLGGILLGHVFLNLPLSFRIIAPALLNIAIGHQRQSLLLNLSAFQWWRIIAYPITKPLILGAFSLIFLLCFTSFALVLMLGGGPAASTLEVAIYEAVRFELDFTLAATLSIIQLLLCGIFLLLMRQPVSWLSQQNNRNNLPRQKNRIKDSLAIGTIGVIFAFLLPPIFVVLWRGIGWGFFDWLSNGLFYQSLFYSIVLATGSAIGNICISILLIGAMQRRSTIWINLVGNTFLFIPTIVFGTGVFLMLRHYDYPSYSPILIVLLANILFTLPFSLRLLAPAMLNHRRCFQRQYMLLNLKGARRLWWGDLRAHIPEIRFAASLTAAMSLGDFGVIALFNSDGFTTLPWLLYTMQGRYQSDQAASLAVWLLILVVGLFYLAGQRRGHHAENQ